MAARPIWRGHLRLALVSCPVALYTVLHGRGGLNFHLINPDTGNRIRMITQDAETAAELSRSDLVKGYEYEKGHYLLMSDEDFEAARVESSTTMTVEKFVDGGSIDPIFFDTSYYLAPDGDSGEDVYAVLHDAIVNTGRVALTRVVIARRERVVALMPMQNGLVAHTLHEARDINSATGLFGKAEGKTDPDMVALATQLIDRQTGRYDPADADDRYEARLRAVIDAKMKGNGVTAAKEEAPASNVVDLMAALRRSLGQGTPAGKAGTSKIGPAETETTKTEPAKSAKAARKAATPVPEKAAPARKPVRKRA